MDVDQELWAVLDLCSDDELDQLHAILHATSPFSPVIKSLMVERDEPALVSQRGRRSVMHRLEWHFRFLAADSAHLLRGARPSYREVLLDVRDKLDIRCSRNLSTFDLETEIFLFTLGNCAEYVQPSPEQGASAGSDPARAASFATVGTVDATVAGAASASSAGAAASTGTSGRSSAGGGSGGSGSSSGGGGGGARWGERLTAPFRLGFKDLTPTLLNLAGAVTVTKVGQQAAAQLATNVVCSHVRYQAALRAAAGMAGAAKGAALAGWGRHAVLETAARSLTAATARYSALRGALSLLGPLMWGWLAVDLALKAIGPDYARVVRAVFLLSQVRLVRTHGFVSAEMEARRDPSYGSGADEDDYMDPGAAFL